jgi:hypothetical protein
MDGTETPSTVTFALALAVIQLFSELVIAVNRND